MFQKRKNLKFNHNLLLLVAILAILLGIVTNKADSSPNQQDETEIVTVAVATGNCMGTQEPVQLILVNSDHSVLCGPVIADNADEHIPVALNLVGEIAYARGNQLYQLPIEAYEWQRPGTIESYVEVDPSDEWVNIYELDNIVVQVMFWQADKVVAWVGSQNCQVVNMVENFVNQFMSSSICNAYYENELLNKIAKSPFGNGRIEMVRRVYNLSFYDEDGIEYFVELSSEKNAVRPIWVDESTFVFIQTDFEHDPVEIRLIMPSINEFGDAEWLPYLSLEEADWVTLYSASPIFPEGETHQ